MTRLSKSGMRWLARSILMFSVFLPGADCRCQQSDSTHTVHMQFTENGVKYDIPLDYSDTIKLSLNSPDKRVIATVVVRDVGATADYSTIVNLRKKGEKLDLDGGNTSDPNRGPDDNFANVFITTGRPKVTLRWTSATALSIVCTAPCETFTKRAKWNGISISYPTK